MGNWLFSIGSSLRSVWQKVRFYWLAREAGHLGFAVMLTLPVLALGGLVRAAYLEQQAAEAARQRRAELACLAENVYFEARGEPLAGQRAVAEVTLNRVASPRFPSTVCEVVHQSSWDPIRRRHLGAFSWTELESRAPPRGAAWERSIEVARSVYDGEDSPLVDGALFYHATHIEPSWAKTKKRLVSIGRHIFYE